MGFPVERSERVVIDNKPGFLIWDYLLWNDIYFVSDDGEIDKILFSHFSDDKIRAKFDELCEKYSPNDLDPFWAGNKRICNLRSLI